VISPVEIKKHEFSRAVRGYDPVEVRNFLETIASEIERMGESLRNQTAEIEVIRAELSAFQRMEQNMHEAMVNVQETLRDAREGARKESDLMRREAEVIAERIIADARRKGEDIRRELETLGNRKESLVRKLRALLRSELELIEMLDVDDFPVHQSPVLPRQTDGVVHGN